MEPTAPSGASLTAGSRLGPYEVVDLLGAGGMGEVYRARETRLGRMVAIKVLPGAFAMDRDRVRRFEQEARAGGSLNHPSLGQAHDALAVTYLRTGRIADARISFLTATALDPSLDLAYNNLAIAELRVEPGVRKSHQKKTRSARGPS